MQMSQNLQHKAAITIAGMAAHTTNAREAGPDGLLPQLWNRYFQNPGPVLPGGDNPHLLYAVYTDYESDVNGAYTVVIGHPCGGNEEAPASDTGMERVVVPEADYLVFESRRGPVFEVVLEAWQEVWAYFQDSPVQRAYTGDFELYDTRQFDPQHAVVHLYIAVRPA
ncbi:MAG: transcriptional regulator [Paenibacillus sp.]|jgi:predicted transcriptional regulator YdeE|nr:transcriptional regulator [Paenibacillus sp.]